MNLSSSLSLGGVLRLFLLMACVLQNTLAFHPLLVNTFTTGCAFPSSSSSSTRLLFGLGTLEKQEGQYLELASAENTHVPEAVFAVMYNPNTEQEQVHFTEFPQKSGQYFLLAFESPHECAHFANLLQQGTPNGVVAVSPPSTMEDLLSFCQQQTVPVSLQLVPEF